MSKNIEIKLLDSSSVLPQKQHENDIGYDLSSSVEITLPSKEVTLVSTGVAISLPTGIAGFILPRSGLASKHLITLINAPGLIDPGYTGELNVPLINHGPNAYTINKHDRIAQLVILKTDTITFEVVDELQTTDRATKGFGSTG